MPGLNGHDAFEARIARLNARRQPSDPVAAGPSPAAMAPRPAQPVKLNDWRENIRTPATIVGAFALGLIAVFVARYLRFHLGAGGLAGETANVLMLLDAALALGAGLALKLLFRLDGKDFLTALAAGVLVMVCTMHNLVHWAPSAFSRVFSPNWTAMVVDTTEPNSILLGGKSFVFEGGTAAPKDKPAQPAFIVLDSQRG